ncbi:hypothetical protein H5410_024585 [Solanum commersonii]|uniref:Uncharacterized protein n=1 Tax=Solanum commersonii TaxID=4109 RepID=A0A9J5ZMF2_SOLCO|nr:hypothetical protein H5410_024585 [Solanum commersonii]
MSDLFIKIYFLIFGISFLSSFLIFFLVIVINRKRKVGINLCRNVKGNNIIVVFGSEALWLID